LERASRAARPSSVSGARPTAAAPVSDGSNPGGTQYRGRLYPLRRGLSRAAESRTAVMEDGTQMNADLRRCGVADLQSGKPLLLVHGDGALHRYQLDDDPVLLPLSALAERLGQGETRSGAPDRERGGEGELACPSRPLNPSTPAPLLPCVLAFCSASTPGAGTRDLTRPESFTITPGERAGTECGEADYDSHNSYHR